MSNNIAELTQALVDLNEEKVSGLVKDKLESGEDPLKILKECNEGMSIVGKRFEEEKYYLSELVMSGEILKGVMNILEPMLGDVEMESSSIGKVVIGTVKNDVHDIGKNIVTTLMKGTGFDVKDLGVDVAADQFIAAIKETGARVIGLSCLLNSAFPQMKDVVDKVAAAGLRDKVKIIIGGAPCNDYVRGHVGADYYAKDVADGIRICKEIYA